jgi:predicted nucleotidyltransferase
VKTERAVQSVLDLVVRCLDPELVVLFGSAAQERARADSDLDLLVVAPFREPAQLRGRELKGLLQSKAMAVDLHLRTAEEAATEQREEFSVVATALRHGRTIYQRAR